MSTSNWMPNPEQQRAIDHGTGPLRIQAGAGSGKTTTLGARIRSLLERGLCRADQILVLTFTTKAVEDLRRKVSGPRIETYHAFALAVVREFADRLGLPPDPLLLTEAPLKLAVRRQIDRLELERIDLTRLDRAVNTVVGFASWHRHEATFRTEPADLLARLAPDDDRESWAELLRAYDRYQALLAEQGAVDYDALIALTVQLLQEHPDVRADLQQRYPFLLVDEYQDTDHLQGEMVRLLAGDAANLTIVGDPDQTIYSFRGAAMTNIAAFPVGFPGLVDVAMLTNYRSTPEILAAANLAIAQNQRRKADLLIAVRPSGPRPQLAQAPDWPAEARGLADQARALAQDGCRYADMAILVRKNSHKAGIYAALVEAGVPVQVVGGLSLFDDPEAVRCVGYLRALAAPMDDEAVAIALTMPRYGLTDDDVAGLCRRRRPGQALLDTVGELAPADARLERFLAEFWPLYRTQFTDGTSSSIRAALDLHAAGFGPETRAGVEQLLTLTTVGSLPDFAAYLEGLRSLGDPLEAVQFDSDQNAVKLMTVHAAKGLEFPVVFLPRLTASDFPVKAKWDRPFPLAWHHDPEFAANADALLAEEERRLFYVAVTRAMDRLYLSWAPVDPRRKRPLQRSPFLDEVSCACDLVEVTLADAEVAAVAEPDLETALAGLVSTAPAAPVRQPAPPAAPVPAPPEVLSFSHLHTYQLCPYRFYLQYLLRLPGRPNRAADEGVRVHAAIEKLASFGGEVSFAEFAAWAAAGPAFAVDAERGSEEGVPDAEGRVDPLRAYWESEYAKVPPIASEQEFFLRVGGAVIRGFIDRVHPLLDGGAEVVDFKTYTRLQSPAEVKAGLQLPLYILACREALGYPEARCGALFFLKHGQVVRVRYSEEELADARRRAEELVAAIGRGDFAPTPAAGVCGFCPYRGGCPVAG